ncbi:MAG: hypothetical protein ACREJU_09420 [Nitrospiraceae bacterium]
MLTRSLFCLSLMLVGVPLFIEAGLAWSAENRPNRGGPPPRAIVAGLQGDALLVPAESSGGTTFLRFHDVISFGDQCTTGLGSAVEVLIGKQALVTVYEGSTVRFLDQGPGQTIVEIMKGDLRIAAVRGDHAMVVRTPSATAVSHGALIHVTVTSGAKPVTAEFHENGSHAVRTSVTPPREAVEVEAFQVLEGLVQMQALASGSSSLTLQAGQSVQILGGRIGGSFKGAAQRPAPLPATNAHAPAAPRVVQYLVDREKTQAEALQRALLEGAAQAFESQADFRNVILATSFGIQAVNTSPAQSGLQGSFNGPGSLPRSPVTGTTVSTPSVPPPTLPSPGIGGGPVSPFIPPSIQPSPGGIGPVGSPVIPQPIPQPTRPLPSLPSLLGTLDILQLDKGKAFKDKSDRFDRPSLGRDR